MSRSFKAMGTTVLAIVTIGGPNETAEAALDSVQTLFQREEARFSRFRPDSELSILNREGGSDAPSDEMWTVLGRATEWWRWSDQLFDPAVLDRLELAGYDKTFDEVVVGQVHMEASARCTLDDLEMTEGEGTRQVRLRDDRRLDLGGIVKGWTVDEAARLLTGVAGYLVDAGGDMRAGGRCQEGYGWPIALEDPMEPILDRWQISLRDAAVATSGTYRRRWPASGGGTAHHIIDPCTGRPSTTDLLAVTVVGPTAEASEVVAKVALLTGSWRALEIVRKLPGAEAIVYLEDGTQRCSSGWEMSMIASSGGEHA